jgi:hypothetical protein
LIIIVTLGEEYMLWSSSSLNPRWRVSSSGIWRRVVCWVATDVSDMFLRNVGCNSTD